MNADEVRKKYLPPKREIPFTLQQDYNLLVQHLNNAKDRNPLPTISAKNPPEKVSDDGFSGKRSVVNEEIVEAKPSGNFFKEDVIFTSNRREQVSPHTFFCYYSCCCYHYY